jgi:hypothetical protein
MVSLDKTHEMLINLANIPEYCEELIKTSQNMLYDAVYDNDIENVRRLIDAGLDVNYKYIIEQPCDVVEHPSLLCMAVYYGQVDMITYLISRGARYFGGGSSTNIIDEVITWCDPVEYEGYEEELIEIIRSLLSVPEFHVTRNTLKYTLNNKYYKIAQFLVESGADTTGVEILDEYPQYLKDALHH